MKEKKSMEPSIVEPGMYYYAVSINDLNFILIKSSKSSQYYDSLDYYYDSIKKESPDSYKGISNILIFKSPFSPAELNVGNDRKFTEIFTKITVPIIDDLEQINEKKFNFNIDDIKVCVFLSSYYNNHLNALDKDDLLIYLTIFTREYRSQGKIQIVQDFYETYNNLKKCLEADESMWGDVCTGLDEYSNQILEIKK